MTSVHPTPTYVNQQLDAQGSYAAPPGAVPVEGYESPPKSYAPPGIAPPPGYGVPVPGAAWGDPAAAGGHPPQQYGVAVAIPVTQQGFAVPPTEHFQAPANRIEKGRWATGLCDCCSNCIPNLFMSWCCPCVSLAQVYARMAMGRYWVVLARLFILVLVGVIIHLAMPSGSTRVVQGYYYDVNGNLAYGTYQETTGSSAGPVGYLVVQIGLAFHVIHARMRVRQRFQIPGSCCGDCLTAWCCSCCAIAQMATHVKSYTPGSCSFGAPDVLPAFS